MAHSWDERATGHLFPSFRDRAVTHILIALCIYRTGHPVLVPDLQLITERMSSKFSGIRWLLIITISPRCREGLGGRLELPYRSSSTFRSFLVGGSFKPIMYLRGFEEGCLRTMRTLHRT